VRFIVLISGILLILLALFAQSIGIDHDAAWGASRYVLLCSGLALTAAAMLVHLARTGHLPGNVHRWFLRLVQSTRQVFFHLRRQTWLSAMIAGILLISVALYAIWFTSFGQFPTFTRVVNPYVDLGEAFLHGQVALLAEPDPALVALDNPYDYSQREQVPYLWDLSYYRGKYYAYWGPVPALLYAAVQAVTRSAPPDQLGVLVFTIGSGVVLAVLLFAGRKRFFPRAPAISIPIFLLAALLNVPLMHILGRPQVYETSVIAGQFFLLLGLLAWLRSLGAPGAGWYFWTGLAWALAVASRYNLALSVAVLLAYSLYRIWCSAGWTAQFRRQALALLAPLGACALALAWYNYIRFGSPFETGLAYQLTVEVYQNRHFSLAYFFSGLYMYLFYPLSTSQQFPFFPSIPVDFTRLPGWAAPPTGRLFDEVFFGLAPSVPAFWLLAVLAPVYVVRGAVRFFLHKVKENLPRANEPHQATLRWQLIGVIALAGLAQFIFLLFYYFGANRFLVDFIFLWLLVWIFLAWEMDEFLHSFAWLRAIFWLAALLLVLSGTAVALLSAFDLVPQFFRLYNPTAYAAIASYNNRTYTSLLSIPDSPGLLGALLRLFLRLAP